ncbi:MAG: GNAT family N-acetyltransferase, partial [Nocardioidaceae bacterium]
MSLASAPPNSGKETDSSSHVGRVTTRPSVTDDADFILELYASTSADELRSLGWTIGKQRTFIIMQAQTEDWNRGRLYPAMDRLTICVDGVPAGRMLISITDTVLHVVDLSLLPAYRGHGIGTQLLGEIMVEARAARVPLKVKVHKDSPAVRFFERLGFGSPGDTGAFWELTWMPPLAAVGPRGQATHRTIGP